MDYLDTDLHLTKDKRFVLMHDATVDRTTNGTGLVRTKTLQQIKQLRLDDGSRVPTLGELLAMSKPSGVHLLIEMKSKGTLSTYQRLAEAIRAFGRSRVRITSFSRSRLDILASIAPRIPQGIITYTRLTPAQVAPYDSVMIDYTQLTAAWLDSMPYPVFAWTLNNEVGWRSSFVDRLAAVITDAPALFMPWRETGCAA